MNTKHLALLLAAVLVFVASPALAEHEGVLESAPRVLVISGLVALLIAVGLALASPRVFWIAMPTIVVAFGVFAAILVSELHEMMSLHGGSAFRSIPAIVIAAYAAPLMIFVIATAIHLLFRRVRARRVFRKHV